MEKYRGVSDVLNGLSGGALDYGFGHSTAYWKGVGKLEAEAWAQFGRVQYENDLEVMKLFSGIFPNLEKDAMLALKGMI